MARLKTVTLNAEQKSALETGLKYGSTPSFRLRCQAILLKNQNHTSLSVAQTLGCCEMSVNDWMKRYNDQGIAGLQIASGRGRKAILQSTSDLETVRRVVQKNRLKVSLAKAELTQELGKDFCTMTLKRFLKKTVANINDCGVE